MRCSFKPLHLFAFFALLTASLFSFGQPPQISYATALTGLTFPVDVVNAGDGSNRLFIAEQGGVVKVWNGTTTKTFANFGVTGADILRFTPGGEEGLLSIAFHPSYDGVSNRYFFIYYTDQSGNIAIRRYETKSGNADTVDAASLLPIITIDHPGQSNHNGGKLNFGADGFLYFATGDGGGGNDVPNNAQNGASLLGKMIRIDINSSSSLGNYSVPAGNPYVADNSVDDRVWAIGLRNPFRWSFDRSTGDMWIGDVGQGQKEEINFRPAGSTGHVNYGWRCYEGYIPTPGVPPCVPTDYVPPVYDYDNPPSGSSAVTGGYVYRGAEFPLFRGYYIAADVYSGSVHLLFPNGSGGFDSSVQTGLMNFIVGFGEAEDGTLYAVSQGTNTLYKVVAVGGTALPVRLGTFAARSYASYNVLTWQTLSEGGTAKFRIEYRTDPGVFTTVGVVPALRQREGGQYSFRHLVTNSGLGFYRLAIEDDDGTIRYSAVIKVTAASAKAKVYPTVVQNGWITVEAPDGIQGIDVINAGGSILFRKDLDGLPRVATIHLPGLSKGVYHVMVKITRETVRLPIIVQ